MDPVIKSSNTSSLLETNLQALAEKSLYRSRRISDTAQGVYLEIDGRKVLNFCSNDYLGLAAHPQVVKAFKAGADQYGVGSGSAHLICGHSRVHHQLEEELAEFTGRDRALLFSNGYMANLGVITGLMSRGDAVFQDRLNHASLLDGGLLSGARFKRYRHADINSLRSALDYASAEHKLIVTDGVFSMDGDFAPLKQLAETARHYDSLLMVDDAHGLGVIGEQGRGLLNYYELDQEQVPILMGTLGKSFGTFGAFVAGSNLLIESLIQKARTYIYTTALPPAIAEATRASLKLVQSEDWRREKLGSLIDHFRSGAIQCGFRIPDSQSAIQPVLVGESNLAIKVSDDLFHQGLLVRAIRPPTVPEGGARLRITLCSEHSKEQVDQLLTALSRSSL